MRREGGDEAADPVPKAADGALGRLPEHHLQLGEGILDWIEVGVMETGSYVPSTDTTGFMRGSVDKMAIQRKANFGLVTSL